jgi:hypothetical protein
MWASPAGLMNALAAERRHYVRQRRRVPPDVKNLRLNGERGRAER